MKLTATNGNRRNLIEGQRVTVTLSNGRQFAKVLPAGNAIRRAKYRPELLDFVTVAAVLELAEQYPRAPGPAVKLFAESRARRLVRHHG